MFFKYSISKCKMMKRLFMLLICLTGFACLTFAQKKDSLKNKTSKEIAFDVSAILTPVLSKNFYGFNSDIKYSPIKKLATGLYFAYAGKKIADTFTYSISKPLINYYEVGWINQYNFLQTDKVRMNVNLNNGISIARLGDDAIKVKQYTRYGYTYVAKEIATNFYYLLEPGADFSLKLFSFNHDPNLWLTTKIKYRFLFGDTKYATTKQFSGYLFAIGFSLTGYTTDTNPSAKKKN